MHVRHNWVASFTTIGCLAFAPLFSMAAGAEVICEPSVSETLDLSVSNRFSTAIKSKNFSAVDDEVSEKLERLRAGKYSDHILNKDIRRAVGGNAAGMEPLLIQWVSEYPKSFAARLFKAQYHIEAGFAKRGGDLANETSKEQFDSMREEFKKAAIDLGVAMSMQPDSAFPYGAMLEMSRAVGGIEASRKLLRDAISKEPKNQVARVAAVSALSPRWGGSFRDLDAIAEGAIQSSMPKAQVKFIQYTVSLAKAGHFEVITKEKNKAIAEYKNAVAICPSVSPWRSVNYIAYNLEQWDTVREAATRILGYLPKDLIAMKQRAWANEKLGRMGEAVPDYQAASDLGDDWAQTRLGYYYMVGNFVSKDLRKARQLLEAAAAQGNVTAKENLAILGK